MQENGWGIEKFKGLPENEFPFFVGPKLEYFDSKTKIEYIFDILWGESSDLILRKTKTKTKNISKEDINLFLASTLVIGLNSQPQIENYFEIDERGIFGCTWMKNRFTRKKWHFVNSHLSFDRFKIMENLNLNFKKAWNLHKIVVTDETIVPFQGKWKYIQHVKGKPHSTGFLYFVQFENF